MPVTILKAVTGFLPTCRVIYALRKRPFYTRKCPATIHKTAFPNAGDLMLLWPPDTAADEAESKSIMSDIAVEKQKCYIDNGKAHLDGKYVLTIDIKKFYDNCTREPVYQFFVQKLKTSPDVAEILTNIITYNGGIPTGCPTSQLMAFYAYSDMFSEISDLAKQCGCKFTLYVDDMTFSSTEPFSPDQLRQMIDRVLRKYSHKPKYRKVKYYGPSDYKPITGTVVTPKQSLAVPNGLQKTIYDAFQMVKPLIGTETCSEEDAKQILSLKGQLQAARNIEEGKFPEIGRLTNQIKVPDSQSVSTRKRQHHRRSKKIHIKQQAPTK